MKEVSFKYIFNEDYNPHYVNGAFGGVGPQGEITINFYCERVAIPYKVKHTLDDKGTLGEQTSVDPDDFDSSYVRYIQTGIIMDKEHALQIYKWMGKVLGDINE